MNEDIFFCVISVDESVAALDVKPFDGAGDLLGDHFFRLLFGVRFGIAAGVTFGVAVGGDDFGFGAVVSGNCGVLRVAHDGKMVRLTTLISPYVFRKRWRWSSSRTLR